MLVIHNSYQWGKVVSIGSFDIDKSKFYNWELISFRKPVKHPNAFKPPTSKTNLNIHVNVKWMAIPVQGPERAELLVFYFSPGECWGEVFRNNHLSHPRILWISNHCVKAKIMIKSGYFSLKIFIMTYKRYSLNIIHSMRQSFITFSKS